MFLFSFIGRLFTHLIAALKKHKSSGEDLVKINKIHKLLALFGHKKLIQHENESGVNYHIATQAPPTATKAKWLEDVLMFEQDKKKKQLQDRIDQKKRGLAMRKRRARVIYER